MDFLIDLAIVLKAIPKFISIFAREIRKIQGMKNNNIIGRNYEQSIIKKLYDSDKAEFVAIYGRRRVGKTYLVKRFFNERFDFYFTGLYETPKQVQLSMFATEIEKKTGQPIPAPKNWFDAFNLLRTYLSSLRKKKIVVFLDELPWMDTPKSHFIQALGYFWNSWASTQDGIKLFVCGSSTTWMLSKIIGDKGGLYGRVTRQIHLMPFRLNETEEFLVKIKGIRWNRYQIMEAYMILGGIPYYLDMLEKGQPFAKSIDDLFFREGAPLRTEFAFLYRSLFKDSMQYRQVVEILAEKTKGMTREELIKALKTKSGGRLTTILDELCSCDFLRKYGAIGKSDKDALYQLTDPFTLFYLRYVGTSAHQDEQFWQNNHGLPAQNAWKGYAFEQICMLHLRQIKRKLSILGVLSNAYSWSCKTFTDSDSTEWEGGQIDLLIDRNDEVISICEMKYSKTPYVITEDYKHKLLSREATFRHVTRTRKALQHVFVTTYGVKQNEWADIVHSEVTIDDLFAPVDL